MIRFIILITLFLLSACHSHNNRTTWNAQLNDADLLLEEKRFEEAAAIYKNIYNEDSSNLRATFGYGRANLALGNMLQAVNIFNKYLSEKKDANAYLYRGMAYDYLDSAQQAIKDYSMAIALDSNSKVAFNNRGLLQVK